jgi:hypothetical protein
MSPRRSPGRAATRPSATTSASRKSGSARATRLSASSSATTRRSRARADHARRHDPPARGRARAHRAPAREGQQREALRGAHQGGVRAARPPSHGTLPAQQAGRGSTAPGSRPRPSSTASSCSPPQTPTSQPRTSRSATRPARGRRGFRDLKATIELRPIFHRLEHRIRGHLLLSWLALLLIRVAERKTGHTWRRIALELGRLHPHHAHRPDRHLRADHPAHRHPARPLRRHRHPAAAAHHRPAASLTPAARPAPTRPPGRGHTRTSCTKSPIARPTRDHARSTCPSTAEPGDLELALIHVQAATEAHRKRGRFRSG